MIKNIRFLFEESFILRVKKPLKLGVSNIFATCCLDVII